MSDVEAASATLAELTTGVVAAYVAQNHVQAAELPGLIASVHATLTDLGQAPAREHTAELPKPAVPIKKSITDEFIISLEDGRRFRSMKRYLSILGMTPDEYRAKWGLPKDYPMVAPAYAAKRSEMARTMGLGRKRVDAPLPDPDEVLEPAKIPEMRKPGRPKRTA